MNILFVTGEYPPQQGGVGAYTAELGQALIEIGATVHVLTTQENAADQSASPTDPAILTDLPTVHPLVQKWGWLTPATIRNVAEQVDADWIHVQYQTAAFGMNPTINFIPYWWQSTIYPSRKVPYHISKNRNGTELFLETIKTQAKRGTTQQPNIAWTYHDLLVPYLFPKAGSRIRRWITERPARDCDLVIATNLGDYQQLVERQPDHQRKFANIPIGSNIVGQTLTAAERSSRRQLRGYTNDEFVIAYFGFLNRSKGGTTLIKTLHILVEAHTNVRLLMIGERVGASDPTNYAYLQEVEALIRSLGVEDKVQWTGGQESSAVSADLAACDVLLMPYEDGASLRRGTLMAGLANYCAIVTTTPEAPLSELVHERDLLYVPPHDPAAAAAAIDLLMADPALLDTLRKNAGERSQLFTWQKIAKEHQALYEQYA